MKKTDVVIWIYIMEEYFLHVFYRMDIIRILVMVFTAHNEKQAKRWAMTKKGESVVNSYEYVSNDKLNLLKFEKMTEEWLNFIVNCRNGIKHNYNIVKGHMADDQIWNFIEGFSEGRISREAFWELVKFNYPTHQICFNTEKALKTLTFK